MNIMIVGGGGREHALLRGIQQNSRVQQVYVLPGNGGMEGEATCVPISATDIDGIVAFATSHSIDFAIVAPDDPLVLGAVDALQAAGIRCFGPTKAAARIEGSKSFAKELMRRYNIPTADYAVFEDVEAALAYVRGGSFPVVLKADGLALGKGVIIAEDEQQAEAAIRAMLVDGVFGKSGARVVIEEFLTGPEVTVLAFTDGEHIVPMVPSMDHKRALDGDRGPNTGGMGVIAPSPFYTEEVAAQCMQDIYLPTIRAMRDMGCPFSGCLYIGLMLTETGPRVIEYNCRFGDPETQTVLPLLETDLLDILLAVSDGTLATVPVQFSRQASCCVMVVSGGYPGDYEKGKEITIGDMPTGGVLYHSGSKVENGVLVTNGGRVLGAVGTGDSLSEAVACAYVAAAAVNFDGRYCRRDVGKRALEG